MKIPHPSTARIVTEMMQREEMERLSARHRFTARRGHLRRRIGLALVGLGRRLQGTVPGQPQRLMPENGRSSLPVAAGNKR